MINIYKSLQGLDEQTVIADAEAFFNGYITSKHFGDEEAEAMRRIDHAELLDRETNTVKTPRGVTSIDNLSTGCKTAIVYIYLLRNKGHQNIIDVSGCGLNALDFIFDLAEKHAAEIGFVLRHKDNVFQCKERDYMVNGDKHITNLAYL